MALVLFFLGCQGVVTEAPAPTGDGPSPTCREPGGSQLRRLSTAEYLRSIESVVGLDLSAESALLPPADPSIAGFDNNAAVQTITESHARAYQAMAERAAALAIDDVAHRSALVGCDPSTDGCVRAFVERVGRRAFRRPLASAEIDRLMEVAATQAEPWAAIDLVLRAMLQAPQFLFRIERGEPDGYALATRLSFALLGAPPDDALLDAAAAGELDDPDSLEAIARAMLDDPRARATMHRFAAQWLRVTAVEELAFDELPRWQPELTRSARAEIAQLADDYLWSDASALDLYRADHTTLDAPLAELYGLPAGRVELAGTERGGLFTTAAFAMVTSRPSGTSIAKRGVYVLEVALCAPPPSPPEGVDTTLPAGMNPDLALDAHVTEARCASCHSLFDPIGRGLERYDPIGVLRERYEDGTAIAGEGRVPMLEPAEFSGGIELGSRIAESEVAARCLVEQYFRFALGRTPDEADRCAIDAVATELAASGMRFRELVIALVRSDVFRRGAVPRSGAGSAKPSDGEWGPGESHSQGRGGAAPSEGAEP